MPDQPGADDRAARRAWIRDNHPDRGGDPAAFAAGLARFDAAPGAGGDHRLTVYRSRNPVRILRRALRELKRQRRRSRNSGRVR